jgi:hypothetical protein
VAGAVLSAAGVATLGAEASSGNPPGPRTGASRPCGLVASSAAASARATAGSSGSLGDSPISSRSIAAASRRSICGTGSPSASTPPSGAAERAGKGPVDTPNGAR